MARSGLRTARHALRRSEWATNAARQKGSRRGWNLHSSGICAPATLMWLEVRRQARLTGKRSGSVKRQATCSVSCFWTRSGETLEYAGNTGRSRRYWAQAARKVKMNASCASGSGLGARTILHIARICSSVIIAFSMRGRSAGSENIL
jgi:hypothetical protein